MHAVLQRPRTDIEFARDIPAADIFQQFQHRLRPKGLDRFIRIHAGKIIILGLLLGFWFHFAKRFLCAENKTTI